MMILKMIDNQTTLHSLRFVDDQIVLTQDEEDIGYTIRKLKEKLE